jgi:hypothetical protein
MSNIQSEAERARKKPKRHVGIGAWFIDWVAVDGELVGCGAEITTCGVEALRCGCWGIDDFERPPGEREIQPLLW